jgi:hypothetical protein
MQIVCGLPCLADHAVYIKRHVAKRRHVQEANALKSASVKRIPELHICAEYYPQTGSPTCRDRFGWLKREGQTQEIFVSGP